MNQTEETKCLKTLLRHIDNVRSNCCILGERLIDKGEVELGHKLIANGYRHDNSKFHGVEWFYLNEESREQTPDLFKSALLQHTSSLNNKHHPEAWVDGIHSMDRLHLAEFVCDIAARGGEFGTDIRGWIREKATKKYSMTVQSKAYKTIKELVDMLLDEQFS